MENAEENEKAKNLKGYTRCMSTRTTPTQEEREETRTIRIKKKRTKTKNGKEKTIQMAAIKKGKER